MLLIWRLSQLAGTHGRSVHPGILTAADVLFVVSVSSCCIAFLEFRSFYSCFRTWGLDGLEYTIIARCTRQKSELHLSFSNSSAAREHNAGIAIVLKGGKFIELCSSVDCGCRWNTVRELVCFCGDFGPPTILRVEELSLCGLQNTGFECLCVWRSTL